MEGHLPCLKFIISVDRDVSKVLGARNDQGETPKSLAEQFCKEECCTYLDALEWEHDHPEQAENLAFPAHVAAYNGDLEHLKLLIEQGVVNINERDERGATLAHKAAGQGHLHILQWLMEMGANMELATQSGETPKDIARRFAQLACLKILGGDADKAETNRRRNVETTDQNSRRKLTPKEEERRRARAKFDELQKQLDIAKKNYRQLGGQFDDDQQREEIELNTQKKMDELETQLQFERFKREKLESELDECRKEILRLVGTVRSYQEQIKQSQQRPSSGTVESKPRKSSSATHKRQRRTEKETGLVFARKNSFNSS